MFSAKEAMTERSLATDRPTERGKFCEGELAAYQWIYNTYLKCCSHGDGLCNKEGQIIED